MLGRGGALLLKHLGSGEVRFVMREENTMLLIAKFVVDASCLQQLVAEPWQGSPRGCGQRMTSPPAAA